MISSIILLLLIASCNKDKSPIGCTPPPPPTLFSYVDAEGNDLLNPENPKAYNFRLPDYYGFKLFYVKNGVKEEAVSERTGRPYVFTPNCNDGSVCVLGVVLSESDTNILELVNSNFNFSDTIYKEDNGYIIRYNGNIVWDAALDTNNLIITIIK